MAESTNSRLETFCDGVFAIALTLLVIDIKLPAETGINNTTELWQAIQHTLPSIFAFLLSFIVILITWVNHHNLMKMISKSTTTFKYANAFLLLSVVIVPFPTSLIGEFILTDHAAPAVILYNTVLVLKAIGWIMFTRTAMHLSTDAKSKLAIRKASSLSYFAFSLYTACTIAAIWFPLVTFIFTTITWIYWLVYGITINPGVESKMND